MTITSKLIKSAGQKEYANGAGSEGDAYEGKPVGQQSAVKEAAKSATPPITNVDHMVTKK